ncbi:uncharacterized protein LOC127569974 [Pristis pectinata]|uniref:uncharacterized protein LOC127569974 n=1 Tax=Pristis pectinata TaxID=685728 RepID=UPI00223CEBD1|nr:uncharacterized protein LOC127569974 [Pristis pectinata]
MRLRMDCSKMPPSLMFGFFVSLLQSGFTQTNPNRVYILDKADNILLRGPHNPGNGPVAWDWKPQCGQGIQRMVTFFKERSSWWTPHWEENFRYNVFFHYMVNEYGTIQLRIEYPTFQFAGSVILAQTQPSYKILKEYRIFGIKVEVSPRQPAGGSDVTLSCTISRLPDTVSLQWERKVSSQQNRRDTDQIRLNNTVYLMVRHVTVEDGKLYVCQVRENGDIVRTIEADFTVEPNLYRQSYTLYRSATNGSELHLICYSRATDYDLATWTWDSHLHQSPREAIAKAWKFQTMNVTGSHFVNRLEPTVTHFNSRNFSMRIFPLVFEDAGVYLCTLDTSAFVTVTLITVKVTAEPAAAVTEGDTVTLTCSVSDVTEPMRLVWINGDGETVGEKSLNGEEKSLSLMIDKADRGKGNWTCGLFCQNRLQLSVPYNVEFRDTLLSNNTNVVIIGSLVLLLIIILGVVLCLKKCKSKDSGNQKQKPPQTGGNTEEASHLYSNATEIQQMQGDETPVPETSHIAEYMSVNGKSKQEDTKEAIHYGSISFKKTSGSRHDMQCSNQSSDANIAASDGDDFVVYAQIAKPTYE